MEPVFVVILVALIGYLGLAGMVGRARVAHGVRAPAMTGHPDFERVNRIHQNTLENLIVFIPAVWIFGMYLSPLWAAALGVAFILARVVYAVGYLRSAEKRGPGAGLTGLVNVALIIGGLVGLVRAML